MSKKPIDHLDHFVRNYKTRVPFLKIASAITPSHPQIRDVVKRVEEGAAVISTSGTSVEIAAQWCKRKGQNFLVAYEATLKVWVLTTATRKEIEAIATALKVSIDKPENS